MGKFTEKMAELMNNPGPSLRLDYEFPVIGIALCRLYGPSCGPSGNLCHEPSELARSIPRLNSWFIFSRSKASFRYGAVIVMKSVALLAASVCFGSSFCVSEVNTGSTGVIGPIAR